MAEVGSTFGARHATVVLFTRDLRVHDHPALVAACRAGGAVLPLFVLDDALLGSRVAAPNRVRFLLDCLHDLRAALEARGGTLLVRRGDVVAETMRLVEETAATAVHVSEDYSPYARRREERLETVCAAAGCAFRRFPGVTIVRPGALRPSGRTHFERFTPYWRVWRAHARRTPVAAPRRLRVPEACVPGAMPSLAALVRGEPSPTLQRGGEAAARKRLARFVARGLARYGARRDELAVEATSRLSADLHFGSVSPADVLARTRASDDGEAFARQLCWRDFHHQVLAADPTYACADHRPRRARWRTDPAALAAWKAGRTGVPIVDAGMRQLAAEGFMPNRVRLLVASFLTKHCGIDWRLGARHFRDLLVDGDVANNAGNWQWVAGTGTDSRPNRVFNPIRQARRHDPAGDYVRRWVPELAGIAGAAVHEPWELADYPPPIVDVAYRKRALESSRR